MDGTESGTGAVWTCVSEDTDWEEVVEEVVEGILNESVERKG